MQFKWLKKKLKNWEIILPNSDTPVTTQQSTEPRTVDLDLRLDWLNQHLSNSSDLATHTFVAGAGLKCALLYVKGMIDLKAIEQHVLNTVGEFDPSWTAEDISMHIFVYKRLPVAHQSVYFSMQEAYLSLLEGGALLLMDGESRMLALSVTAFEKRSIQEAPNEAVIRGPREAFIESMDTNLTMIRRRLKTPSFKMDLMHIGTETQTSVAIVYLQGKCKQDLVDEVKKRLSAIEIDSVLGSSYLEEFIEDYPFSPFPQLQSTERPDVVSAALLEGRVAIIVDGTPIALIAPVTFFMLLQSAEDYYQRFVAANWIRVIRMLFLFISLLMPSVYVAITTFHPDIIPERLLITIASSREIVPFPALIEAFLMELSFEALREATVRIPKSIGQSVSIIGALIIGNAAVEAGIASAAMVIIVALTGIASFIIPHFDLGLAFRLLRFPIMILAGTFGLIGIACGMILIYLHLLELRSFDLPYLSPIAPLHTNDLKDTIVRAPWWAMKNRPSFFDGKGRSKRLKTRSWGHAKEEEE